MSVASLVYPAKRFVYNGLWILKSMLWLFVRPVKEETVTNNTFSIGIVTYVDRFETFFKPLIRRLATLFPDTEFVIAINGYHDQIVQGKYLDNITHFLSTYKNVKIVDFHRPQSLSKLWNKLILHSSFDKIMILNDDLKISPGFRRDFYRSGVVMQDIALINRSWSHFIISKKIIGEIGWFDERFPGVGNEDEDYECRLVLKGIFVKSFRITGLKNITFLTVNFSYGKDTEVINKKYVKGNKAHFDKKWLMSPVQQEGFVYCEILKSFVKLREGMETPDFYPVT